MLGKKTRNIVPLVLEPDQSAWTDRVKRQSIPLDWIAYARSCDTTKDSYDQFTLPEKLRVFLENYQHRINYPSGASGRMIFFSFFVQINKTNSSEVNNLHLSKVIVLLQLLADPNLSMSEHNKSAFLLHSLFEMGQLGLDTLHVLFSYGLTYEKFLLSLVFFIKTYITDNVDQEVILGLLESSSTVKMEFSKETNNLIYKPILDISENNAYTQVYQYLRMAYASYQQTSYQQAAEFYQKASETLTQVLDTNELNPIIRKDYCWRREQSERYSEICQHLFHQKQSSGVELGHSDIFSTISSFFFTSTEQAPINVGLIKYKQS